MSETVLDASALIAYMSREPGWERVEAALPGALMSCVNYAEVLSKVAERGGDAAQTDAELGPQLNLVPFSPAQALLAAQLRPLTRQLGLSLGDRACLALGLERRAAVLSADQPWAALEAPHIIEVIR